MILSATADVNLKKKTSFVDKFHFALLQRPGKMESLSKEDCNNYFKENQAFGHNTSLWNVNSSLETFDHVDASVAKRLKIFETICQQLLNDTSSGESICDTGFRESYGVSFSSFIRTLRVKKVNFTCILLKHVYCITNIGNLILNVVYWPMFRLFPEVTYY